MRTQIGMLLLVLIGIAIVCSIQPSSMEQEQTVDGIRLGEDQTSLEARLGRKGQAVNYYEDPNCTGWTLGKERIFFGNHPEEAGKLKSPLLQGLAYGTKDNSYLPLVGYNAQRRVEWICGNRLNSRQGKALLSAAAEKSPRPGYCMAGPCGWRTQNGQISISNGGEGIASGAPDRWTVLLLTPGPLSQTLQREQEEGQRLQEELERSLKNP